MEKSFLLIGTVCLVTLVWSVIGVILTQNIWYLISSLLNAFGVILNLHFYNKLTNPELPSWAKGYFEDGK